MLTARTLLDLVDRAEYLTTSDRVDMLASECAAGDGVALTIGERDGALLRLREQIFGPDIPVAAPCPQCMNQAAGLARTGDLDFSDPDKPGGDTFTVEADGYVVTARPLSAEAVRGIVDAPNHAAARRVAVRAGVVVATCADIPVAVGELPEVVVDALSDELAKRDPQSDVALALTCVPCQATFETTFDIGSLLWVELHAAAARLTDEVAVLAAGFGWSEAEILDLTPARRARYVNHCRSQQEAAS